MLKYKFIPCDFLRIVVWLSVFDDEMTAHTIDFGCDSGWNFRPGSCFDLECVGVGTPTDHVLRSYTHLVELTRCDVIHDGVLEEEILCCETD